jgi:hypothetical protein
MPTKNDHNLPTRIDDRKRSVELHDNGLSAGNLIDHALSRLDSKQVQALGLEAGKEVVRMQGRQQQQNIDYVTGKKVVEDHIDTWDALNKTGRTTRQSVTTDIETGAGRMRIESKSGATCFVATAAYEDWRHPDVEFLRWYRDSILVESIAGKTFIRIYWYIGPHLAKLVTPLPVVRKVVRYGISRLVRVLQSRYLSKKTD